MYTIYLDHNNNLIHQSTTASIINDSTLYSSLRSSVPQIVQNVLLTHFIDSNMFDHLIFNEDTQTDCAQCFTLQPLPSPDSWSTAYKSDSDTLAIINALKNSPDTSNIMEDLGVSRVEQCVKRTKDTLI